MENWGVHPEILHAAPGRTDSRETMREVFTGLALGMGHEQVSHSTSLTERRRGAVSPLETL